MSKMSRRVAAIHPLAVALMAAVYAAPVATAGSSSDSVAGARACVPSAMAPEVVVRGEVRLGGAPAPPPRPLPPCPCTGYAKSPDGGRVPTAVLALGGSLSVSAMAGSDAK